MAEPVTIDRLGASGDGIAHLASGPVYVAGALPGEAVTIERSGDRGALLSRDSTSPDRIEPFCPYYGRCGGCAAQHVGPALYSAWKRDKVVSALDRAGIAAEVEPLVDGHGAGRRRVTFHGREVGGHMPVGFMAARSHHVVEIERCPITVPALAPAAKVARQLADTMRRARKPLDIAVTSTVSGLDIDLRGSGRPDEGLRQALIREAGALDLARLSIHGETLVALRRPLVRMGGALVSPPAGGFLQATEIGEEVLATAVVEGCAGSKRVADLFAGSGPFALRLAESAEVHAVESDAAALASLDRAARETRPGLRRVTTEARDLFRRPLLPPDLERFDAVVLDPPRAGAEAQVGQLILSSVRRVIMVSCDPGTFARDAATLVRGDFRVRRVLPVDLFAWSSHVEIVGVFERPKPRRGRR